MTDDDSPEFKKAVAQETERLRLVHPTHNDIPSCLNLFELVTSCHGALSSAFPPVYLFVFPVSHPLASEIVVSLWGDASLLSET